ncbi:MAG TPA: ABC transporter substrate-binding protein [Ramlibacter sp.]|jgi:ABC-type branched-subunit amino acid transport system substrate-binding protein|uniref:ABC transporter substrate-binding protein n=1 Tax=Ramlibacter sp. TaxID=1917967 RepID=UPI002D397471|nr:ABC transporter substrate-binding protein [Ramlibacter sp.]HZY19219.1 ABC transporter substrate-binding protein [Ramlibacter sp.]
MKRLLAVAALAFAGAALAAGAKDGSEIVIGQVAPLTGTIAGTGDEYVAGGAAYFAHVNASGGIGGRRIRVVVKDDSYKPEQTLALTRELLEKEQPLALFGFVGTGNVLALNKNRVLEDAGIALLAPYTGALDLREPMNPHIFHVRASYSDETARMVEQLSTLGLRKFAVFYQDDPFGKSGLAGAESAMRKLGQKLVASGAYDRTKPEEVDAAVAAIAPAAPEAVIMVSVNRASSAFIKKLRAQGSNARMFSISVVNFKELLKNAGEDVVRGVGISQVMPFPYAPQIPVVREFQQMMAKYQPGKVVSYASIESYIAAKVLVEAIRRAGPNPTRAGVMTQLEKMNDYDTGGFPISFSRENRVGSKFVEVTVIGQNGKLMR